MNRFGKAGRRISALEKATQAFANLPHPPVGGDARAHDAWAAEYSRRSFDLRTARLDAGLAAARFALSGATIRSLPGRGLGLFGALVLGDWLRGGGAH